MGPAVPGNIENIAIAVGGQRSGKPPEIAVAVEADGDVLRLGLQRLVTSDSPQLRTVAPSLADYDGEADEGMDVLPQELEISRNKMPQPESRETGW